MFVNFRCRIYCIYRKKDEALIETIVHGTDATNPTNAVMNNADKKLSSSLYNVLGLTMTYESKSLKILRKRDSR